MSELPSACILIVTASAQAGEQLAAMLPQKRCCAPLFARTTTQAKQLHQTAPFDLIIVNTPLPDDFGTDFALFLSKQQPPTGILLLCEADQYDAIAARTEYAGVLVLQKPLHRQLFVQGIGLLLASTRRLQSMEEKTRVLHTKMEEVRLVDRAKLLLMERLQMTESQAHRYLEKTAMDRCVTRSQVSLDIIKTYEN